LGFVVGDVEKEERLKKRAQSFEQLQESRW
jgi:hypothetical protein